MGAGAWQNPNVDVQRYLERIGLTEPPSLDLAGLERLQRAHLSNVPFENLDVFHRRGVRTDEAWSIPKIVERERGGWCFELNGAFAGLLSALGFSVNRLAATVLYGGRSPMPTHLTVAVSLDRPYLVDVGFGDSFIKPLPLDSPGPHDGGTEPYGFVFEGDITTLISWDEEGQEVGHYRFDRIPRTLTDFEEAALWLQTEPGLQWTVSPFATRLLDGGPDRVTLLKDRLKLRRQGVWSERPVSEEQWSETLSQWFRMTP